MALMKFFRKIVILIPLLLLSCSETSIDSALKKYNKGSVPYITVEELVDGEDYLILDSREKEEFNVSHIPDAHWVGYDSFSLDKVNQIITETDVKIVVYCSVGVRSEDIGEQLLRNGYTEVKNLYGGIFQWKNNRQIVVDSMGQETQNVHVYSKYWSRLLTHANKVY